ncbi:MAG: hypothetical protein OEN55_13135 [Alphaproteobacteria bacterium]|nr:hypothetical protein [Alphaproteobacteria bacterium]
MSDRTKLRVWGTAFDSWRFLLRWPQATLLTMVLATLWLHAALGAASLLSYTVSSVAPGAGPDGHAVSLFSFAVSGVFALSGWLVLAALIMVLWERAAAGRPAVAGWSDRGPLARAVGQSALVLVALGALWVVAIMLLGLPFGARPAMMIVAEAPFEIIPEEAADRLLDPKLLMVFGVSVAAAFVPGRLALILPAVALGQAVDFRSVWSLGRSNGWRLLATIVLVLLPLWLTGAVLDPPYVPWIDRDWLWWMRDELDRALNGLLFAMAGIVLALCYRTLADSETDTKNA